MPRPYTDPTPAKDGICWIWRGRVISFTAPAATVTTETIHYCATHPDVETALACGKCEKLICPRCMVQTPVGARCKACAQLRRPPMYALGPASLARVYGAAIGLGVAAGLLWGFLLPGAGFFLGFLLIFAGMAAGYGMANALEWAGGRKRGIPVQIAAVAGIVTAYLVQNLVATLSPVVVGDLWGLIFVGVASIVAWNRLR